MSASKIFKKIAIFILFIVFVFILIFFVVNRPKFLAGSIKNLINNINTDIVVKDIAIEQIQWFSWRSFNMSGVNVDLKFKGTDYHLTMPSLFMNYLEGFYGKRPIILFIKDFKINSNDLKLSNGMLNSQIFFEKFKYGTSLYSLSINHLGFKTYEMNDVRINALLNKELIFIDDTTSKFYEGSVSLKGWYKFTKEASYKIEGHLDHVNTALLAQTNAAFSHLMVITNGDFLFSSSLKEGASIHINLLSPTGGFMKASLLQFLAKYVPQKQQLEELIRNNEEIPVNRAQVEIISMSADKISSNIKLFSSSVNLDMNVKFDINIDGGFWNALEYIN